MHAAAAGGERGERASAPRHDAAQAPPTEDAPPWISDDFRCLADFSRGGIAFARLCTLTW